MQLFRALCGDCLSVSGTVCEKPYPIDFLLKSETSPSPKEVSIQTTQLVQA